MTKEVELRAKVNNFNKVRKELKILRAKFLGGFKVKDTAFDKPNNYFYKKGIMIRLRSIEDSKGNNRHFLAYKAPSKKNSYKVLEEIETEVLEGDKIVRILEYLGLKIPFYMEKIREIYQLRETEVALDHYPFLGYFVEIEGSPKNIEKTIKKLKMKRNDFNNRSLDYYIDKTKKRLGRDFKLTFKEEGEFLNKNNPIRSIKRQLNNLDSDEIKKINLKAYRAISHNYYEWTKSIIVPEIIDKFISLINKNGKILDLGCGPGRDLKFFQEKGLKAFGVDICPEMIAIAKKRSRLKNVYLGDMYNLPFDDNFFAGIYCCASLSHIPKKDLVTVLNEIKRVCRKNAVMFCSVKLGNREDIIQENKYGKMIKRFWAFYQVNEIKKRLNGSGFKIINYQITGPLTNQPSGKGWINIFSKVIKG